jgi:dTDP-glucose 4,6-dehydratase
MKLIVTGGAGFIGSNFIRYLLEEKNDSLTILNLDKLTYAGNLDNLTGVSEDKCYRFVRGDIADIGHMREIFETFKPDAVINFAAESHVDRSIEDVAPFIRANVQGTPGSSRLRHEFWHKTLPPGIDG